MQLASLLIFGIALFGALVNCQNPSMPSNGKTDCPLTGKNIFETTGNSKTTLFSTILSSNANIACKMIGSLHS